MQGTVIQDALIPQSVIDLFSEHSQILSALTTVKNLSQPQFRPRYSQTDRAELNSEHVQAYARITLTFLRLEYSLKAASSDGSTASVEAVSNLLRKLNQQISRGRTKRAQNGELVYTSIMHTVLADVIEVDRVNLTDMPNNLASAVYVQYNSIVSFVDHLRSEIPTTSGFPRVTQAADPALFLYNTFIQQSHTSIVAIKALLNTIRYHIPDNAVLSHTIANHDQTIKQEAEQKNPASTKPRWKRWLKKGVIMIVTLATATPIVIFAAPVAAAFIAGGIGHGILGTITAGGITMGGVGLITGATVKTLLEVLMDPDLKPIWAKVLLANAWKGFAVGAVFGSAVTPFVPLYHIPGHTSGAATAGGAGGTAASGSSQLSYVPPVHEIASATAPHATIEGVASGAATGGTSAALPTKPTAAQITAIKEQLEAAVREADEQDRIFATIVSEWSLDDIDAANLEVLSIPVKPSDVMTLEELEAADEAIFAQDVFPSIELTAVRSDTPESIASSATATPTRSGAIAWLRDDDASPASCAEAGLDIA